MASSDKTLIVVLEDLRTKLFHVRSPEDIAAFKAELDLAISDAKEAAAPPPKEAKEPKEPKEQTVAVKKTTY